MPEDLSEDLYGVGANAHSFEDEFLCGYKGEEEPEIEILPSLPRQFICNQCNGNKVIRIVKDFKFKNKNDLNFPFVVRFQWIKCYACNGKGKIEEKNTKKTMKKIMKELDGATQLFRETFYMPPLTALSKESIQKLRKLGIIKETPTKRYVKRK